MTAGTLELSGAALVVSAVLLVRAIITIGIVVTTPFAWNASFVGTLELALGTFSVEIFTERSLFVRSVSTIILEVASPPEGNAATVCAFKVARWMALRTGFGVGFVRVVADGGRGTDVKKKVEGNIRIDRCGRL